jgi:hypothetical protein
MYATILLVFAVALIYVLLRVWRRRNAVDPADRSSGFRPRLGFTRLDGMESLSLLLENESRKNIWVEEIEIYLSELVAENQTGEPTCSEIQKIRQVVQSGDMLPISLSEVIYRAAGEPQRKHSSILSSIVRYRIDEQSFEKNLDNYRIQMMGLTASGVHRERKPVAPFPGRGKSQEFSELAVKTK